MKKHHSKRNKKLRNKKSRRKKQVVSIIYNMITDSTRENNETFRGKPFFRKLYSTEKSNKDPRDNEKKIIEYLLSKPKHPNIVDFYNVTDDYIDMEILTTSHTNENYSLNSSETDKIIKIMEDVKDYLQSIGIIYIDWKFGNIAKDKNGIYKLFDFDLSGIIDTETMEWIIKPFDSYNYRTAIQNNCMSPIEIDDWSFELNMNGNYAIKCPLP